MKKDDLIKSMLNEAENIQIPELSDRVRMEPIVTVPSEVKSETRARHKNTLRILTLAIIMIMGFGMYYTALMRPETKVTVDINPSIELTLNRNDRVIGVRAFNEEGQKFLRNLSIMYQPLDEAVENIVAIASDMNYVSKNDSNAILLSVKSIAVGKESFHEETLEKEFTSALTAHGITARYKHIDYTAEDEIMAQRYNVSPAKLAFIRDLLQEKYDREYKNEQIPVAYFTKSVTQLVNELE